jgi:hypothetical protein
MNWLAEEMSHEKEGFQEGNRGFGWELNFKSSWDWC